MRAANGGHMQELKTILFAEDDPDDVELTLKALGANKLANRVETVRDGEAALDYLYRRGKHGRRPPGNPALVLLDIKMPKLGGLEVLRAIRADANLRDIPVVMLTSSSEEKDLLESYKSGVNAYVVKPLSLEEFMAAVGSLGFFWALVNEPPPGCLKQRSRRP